jgi:hypothetical protein
VQPPTIESCQQTCTDINIKEIQQISQQAAAGERGVSVDENQRGKPQVRWKQRGETRGYMRTNWGNPELEENQRGETIGVKIQLGKRFSR